MNLEAIQEQVPFDNSDVVVVHINGGTHRTEARGVKEVIGQILAVVVQHFGGIRES